MRFRLQLEISAPIEDVFAFFRDKHLHVQRQGSAVSLIEKITPEPVKVGTQFREVVNVFPWYQMEIRSEVTRFEPVERIAEDFWGPAMRGDLEYQFSSYGARTQLVQLQNFYFSKGINFLLLFIRPVLGFQLRRRLRGIKRYLERVPISP
jgi:hypothetical protein